MCLRPIKIRNPTERIARIGGTPLILEVPCGQCAECKKKQRLEWRFRTYHEVTNCINHGGYVLFDTLTYRPADVPFLSRFIDCDKYSIKDCMCYDSTDWRNFLKNLRRQLDYHYPGVHFKYFLTSEYGTDERYTHRPHYHVLFFINNHSIHPYDFSRLVSDCWTFGRTDGIPYQPSKYVADHVFGYDLGTNSANDCMKVVNYVSKYITKDSSYQSVIDKRLKVLYDKLDKETWKILKRNVSMYHRQSKGFGISFIDNLSIDEFEDLKKKGVLTLCDKDKVIITIPLCLYYKRKLFYDLKKVDDKYCWYPNSHGLEYLYNMTLSNINRIGNDVYATIHYADDFHKDYIYRLLNGRSVFDYASYLLLFRNRYVGTDDYITLDWSSKVFSSKSCISDDDCFIRDKENNTIYINDNDIFHSLKPINYDSFIFQNVISQDSCPEFHDFDKLSILLSILKYDDNVISQKTFDFIEQLTKIHKHIKLYGY